MADLRTAAQQALEALEHVVRQAQENLVPTIHYGPVHDVMNNLRAALAEPVQEPVAFVNVAHLQGLTLGLYGCVEIYTEESAGRVPLYAAPPQRKPLSNEELDRLWREPMSADWEHREYARAIEAAHGIKEGT